MTIAARQVSQSRRIGNLYELVPDVFAREKTPERLRRPLESLHDVDLGSNLPGRSPARELGDCFPKAGGEGQDQEAAHGRASEDEVQIVSDWRHVSEVVVAGDRAAQAAADVIVQTSPDEWVKCLSADVEGRRRWLRQQRAAGTRQRLDELMTSFGVLQQTLRSREPGSQRAAMAKN